MPISFRLPPNRLVWLYNLRGAFTVSSGHRVARALVQSTSAGASSSEGSNAFSPLWKAIWRAKIPPKVKNFTWKISQNIIPTKVNLVRKGVHLDMECWACSGHPETDGHVFQHCINS
ncbi:hypothetical protein ACFX13_008346 [Malus domestica]